MNGKPMIVKWALRKAKTRPETFLASHAKYTPYFFSYLSKNALKFDTKEEAENYARYIYERDSNKIVWEPISLCVVIMEEK